MQKIVIQCSNHKVYFNRDFECCAYYTGESSAEVKTVADSSDHTEHSRDDKPRPYLLLRSALC